MTDSDPFIRVVELYIGPLAEHVGGGPRSSALKIISDGSRDGLRVRFNVKKSLLGTANPSTIHIYNLPANTRSRIRESLTKVELLAGYKNTGVSLLASGALLTVTHDKEGPDLVTTLSCLDGYGGTVRGVSNRSYGGSISLAEVIRNLASDIPGVRIGRIDVDGALGAGGRIFTGRASEALDQLAEQYGFSWSIQDGVLQALSDLRAFPRSTEISAANRTLFSAQPILNGPMQQETGADISAVLDARVLPGERVRLVSENNPQLNGFLKVHNVDFDGDTFDSSWKMRIQSFKVL